MIPAPEDPPENITGLPCLNAAAKVDTRQLHGEGPDLVDENLKQETIDVLHADGWPVGDVFRVWSAGETDTGDGFGRDTVIWVTPGGVPMTSLLGVNFNDKAYVLQTWEGWTS